MHKNHWLRNLQSHTCKSSTSEVLPVSVHVCKWLRSCQTLQEKSKDVHGRINTARYMGIIWAHQAFSILHFLSLSVSPVCLSLSLAHFPNQVLKRNIKHFYSTIPPLSNWGSVCVHGVYDPKPFEVLIFPCVSQCLRPPTVQQPHNAPFLMQPQPRVNSDATLHQSSDPSQGK